MLLLLFRVTYVGVIIVVAVVITYYKTKSYCLATAALLFSNGGVFGSLFGTPIINPPQSAILGMHGVFERPVVRNGQVNIILNLGRKQGWILFHRS